MNYSFNAVRNETTDRMLAAPDSALHLFMYLFITTVDAGNLSDDARSIYDAYQHELAQPGYADVNLRAEEVYQRKSLTQWYLSSLVNVLSRLDTLGNTMDVSSLNGIDHFKATAGATMPASKLYNLINDICWLLTVQGYYPSGDFKWFEDSVIDF